MLEYMQRRCDGFKWASRKAGEAELSHADVCEIIAKA
jgi:hypothetical protein